MNFIHAGKLYHIALILVFLHCFLAIRSPPPPQKKNCTTALPSTYSNQISYK